MAERPTGSSGNAEQPDLPGFGLESVAQEPAPTRAASGRRVSKKQASSPEPAASASSSSASSSSSVSASLAASPLVDAEARDRIAQGLDQNLFVEAGAGSGKTTALVTRIVNLVASGVPVNRIAAITFTEAAARELRTRVRDELDRVGRASGDQKLTLAAGHVEAAAFTTVHGFALRILSDYPVEAGLPPGFGVVDEITSILEFDEAWRVFLGRVGDDLDLEELQLRAMALRIDLSQFAGVARRFDDNWDLLELVTGDPPTLSPISFEHYFDRLDDLRRLLDLCISPDDLYHGLLTDYIANVERLALRDEVDQLESFGRMKPPHKRKGRSASWRDPGLDHVRGEVEAFNQALVDQAAAYRNEVMEYFVVLVAEFVRSRVHTRRTRGELSFHDLLVLARRLLRRNPRVREILHQRYNRLLLDEFQDTDPIQIELAVLLAAPGLVDERPWQELAADIEPGRLVVVGDPKQSIYRFRRADIAVYNDTEQVLVDEPTRLTTNFRSVPGILAWVNRLFESVMGEGSPGVQPAYIALDPARSELPAPTTMPVSNTAPVTVLGGPHDDLPIREVREVEGRDVAAVVCRIMEEGWLVRDRDADGGNAERGRPARLADIAVLIPSRLTLPSLETAFSEANVPFRPETSSLVYATQEVRDVLAGVRATVDPTSSIDVVATLRSGLFSVGDDALLDWKLRGGSWDYRAALPEVPQVDNDGAAGDPVAEAFAQLRRWHADRWWMSPASFIDRIVSDRRLREAALAESRPRDRWRRYRFLSEQARQFTEAQGGDLHDFVDWVEIQASDLARVTEPIPPEPDDDAVRVLTVHGSKGLEFPIVILAGAPTIEAPARNGPRVLFPPGGRPQVKLGGDRQTADYDLHAAMEDVLDANERVRLHYVAATRAEDHLIVSAHHKQPGSRDKRTSIGRRTWEAIQSFPELWQGFEATGDEHYAARRPTQLRLAGGSWAQEVAEWERQQDQIQAAVAKRRPLSATAIAEAAQQESATELDLRVPGGVTPSAAVRAVIEADAAVPGSALGSAVHRVLEKVEFDEPEQIAALARSAAQEFGIAAAADEVARRAHLAVASPTLVLARSVRHHRELFVAAPNGDGVIEGFVDLLLETDDGLLIVDYKTDDLSSMSPEEKVERYRLQAATYAGALATITGQPIAGCRFLFVGPDEVIEADVENIELAIEEARALARSALRAVVT